ncbi:MAG: polysaccharide deacetylase family protein [Bacteroidota bacterium]|nr:polysaccharide deacetylase family protein [Bacteroidota bacterium]
MYHKIGEPSTDVWDIAVSEQHLEEHFLYLKKKNIISLEELIGYLQKKKIKKNCIAITFDDGYLDNFLLAKPLLEKFRLPATFFIPTIDVGQQKEFWWDELEYIFLSVEELPPAISMVINGVDVTFDLSAHYKLTFENKLKHKEWRAYEETPPTIRCEVFLKIWELLKPLKDEEQQAYLKLIRAWAGVSVSSRKDYQCMSVAEIKELSSHKLFQIEAHTETHIALGFQNEDLQKSEIVRNKTFLESITGKKTDLLAYPYGNFNDETLIAARQAGMLGAFTTEEERVNFNDGLYRINRCQVKNQNGIEFKNKIGYWLNHK